MASFKLASGVSGNCIIIYHTILRVGGGRGGGGGGGRGLYKKN